ncbi:hypothetical protein ABN034_09330 [Actinopolymorpha sp. B11F2]|uniref:hypothetical protein n=1 Tax=Actinopolymorpha sp. B11F2 TaxID=3160862 RepID=UPI0032E45281
MNPFLKAQRERYERLRSNIAALQDAATRDGRDFSEDEVRQVNEQAAEARTLAASIEYLTDEDKRAEQVRELAARLDGGDGQVRNLGGGEADPYGDEQTGVPALMPSRAQVADMFRAVADGKPLRVTTGHAGVDHTRAVVTLAGDVGTPQTALSARTPIEPRRIALAANLTSEGVSGASGAVFPVFLAGAAGQTAENVAKTEYFNINPGTAAPKTLAVWTDFTRQASSSHTAFEGRLRQKLAALVAAQQDILLCAKVLGTTGIQVQAATGDPMAQQLLVAAGKVAASDVGQAPDLVAVNPADLGKIMGAGVGNTPPGELAELHLTLHGMVVYPTTAITAGTALVGAWRAASRLVVGMSPTYMLDPYTQMKSNIITALLEEAVDLAVEEPSGFVNVDLVV